MPVPNHLGLGKGKGVPENDKTGEGRPCAEQGNVWPRPIWLMYDEGKGVPENDKTAAVVHPCCETGMPLCPVKSGWMSPTDEVFQRTIRLL